MLQLFATVRHQLDAFGCQFCRIVHSRFFWQASWIGDEGRIEMRCSRCGRIH